MEELKSIDIIFYRGKSLFSKLIKWKTSGVYSHCEFINGFEDNGFETYGALNKVGVQFASINWHKKKTKYDIFTIKITKSQFEELRNYLTKQYKKKYDYLGILGFVDNRIKQDNHKWFCSELIYKSLQHIGVELFNREVKFPSPQLISLSPLLKLVKSGVVLPDQTKEEIKANNDLEELLENVRKSSIQGDNLKKKLNNGN